MREEAERRVRKGEREMHIQVEGRLNEMERLVYSQYLRQEYRDLIGGKVCVPG